MGLYEFTVILDRVPNDESEFDALFAAGLDDTTPTVSRDRCTLDVAREAESLPMAIVSVARDAKNAGFRIVGIQQDDLVSLKAIATRLGRSYESVRLWANGKRGPGGFPRPVSDNSWSLYSWSAVSEWLEKNGITKTERTAAELRGFAAANALVSTYSVLQISEAKEFEALAELVGKH